VIWGTLSDKIGRKSSLFLITFVQGVMMLSLIRLGGNALTLYLAAALIGFNYGANFSIFPAVTADFFGTKNIGGNYGLLLSALGAAGLIGPLLGGRVFDLTGSYLWAFVPAAAMCFVAALLSVVVRAPERQRGE
jgi:OFA family oxalate/formate antiporter-like MFS transporter